jgi:hypothetical protein
MEPTPMEYRPLPFTVHPSKKRLIRFLITAIAFTSMCVWLGIEGERFGWVVAAFFGLGIVVFVHQLRDRKNLFLTVDEHGIEFGSSSHKSRFGWNELSEFKPYAVIPYVRGQVELVGFNFSPSYNGPAKASGVGKAMYGFDHYLPDTYGFRAKKLAELLTHYLKEHGRESILP